MTGYGSQPASSSLGNWVGKGKTFVALVRTYPMKTLQDIIVFSKNTVHKELDTFDLPFVKKKETCLAVVHAN